jgi:Lrp/AsnC family transcriptional regulator of ectoine degradation
MLPSWDIEKALIACYHAGLALRSVMPMTTVMMEVTLRNHRQSDFDRFERAVR